MKTVSVVFACLFLCTTVVASNLAMPDYEYAETLFKESHPEALKIVMDKIERAKQHGNSGLQAKLHRLVFIYADSAQERLKHLISALKITEMLGDDYQSGLILTDLSELSRAGQDYSIALEYVNRALTIFTDLESETGLAHAYNRRAAINFEIGPNNPDTLKTVLEDARESLTLSEKLANDRLVFNNLNIIGAALASLGEPDEAIVNLERALEVIEKNNWSRVKPNILNNLSSAYQKLGNWDKAIEKASESLELATLHNDVPYILGAREALYHANKYKGDFKASLYHLELLTALSIEQYFSERDGVIEELHIRYATHQKEHAIQVEKARRRSERMALLSLLVSSLFILAMIVVFVFRNKNRTIEANNLIISSQLDEISRLCKEKDHYIYRFNLVASTFNMGIWEVNLKTGKIFWDSRMYNLFEIYNPPYPDPKDVISRCFDAEEQLLFEQFLEKAIRDRGLIHHVFNVCNDKSVNKWLEAHAVVVFDDRDTPESVIGAVRDISRQKVTEFETLAFKDRIYDEQKMESLNTMAGGIAHDFNNLLTVIIGNLEMAKSFISDGSSGSDHLMKAFNAAVKAEKITHNMLDFCGSARSFPGMMNISDVLKEEQDNLQTYFSDNVILAWQLTEELPLVHIDRVQFQQLVIHLVKNSIEAIFPKSGVVTIATGVRMYSSEELKNNRFYVKSEAGQFVYMDIIDNGCGIDVPSLNKIFDPFYSTKMVGRGLGLASVSGIVRGHGGAIFVNSVPQKGTTITILFPVPFNG
jgi:signal transduction histidine kinase/tetratricopeptide (TPR) repeat protein